MWNHLAIYDAKCGRVGRERRGFVQPMASVYLQTGSEVGLFRLGSS
jgi:hypothetical protein